jgi:hypothetical protein
MARKLNFMKTVASGRGHSSGSRHIRRAEEAARKKAEKNKVPR